MKKIIFIVVFLICPILTQAQDLKIILFGDSLMAGYGLDQSNHLDRLLERDLLDQGIVSQITNASVSGDTSSGGLNRLSWSLQDDYDLFILGLGANDMLRGISPNTTKANLKEIIKIVQKKNISILLTGMQAPSSYGQDYQSSFNLIYPQLAKEYEIFLYPFLLEGVALEPNLNQSDGKHPNEQGITLISKKIAEKIKNILN
jgi:acyl-CoA thioesterase-1|tara:strand:+ start:4667 stop:5272 length:606 start_codon:yes stop_codon:yes gene_type:complete